MSGWEVGEQVLVTVEAVIRRVEPDPVSLPDIATLDIDQGVNGVDVDVAGHMVTRRHADELLPVIAYVPVRRDTPGGAWEVGDRVHVTVEATVRGVEPDPDGLPDVVTVEIIQDVYGIVLVKGRPVTLRHTDELSAIGPRDEPAEDSTMSGAR